MTLIAFTQIVFWLSAFVIFYVYVGYPLLVFAVSRFFPKPIVRAAFEPQVSIIITAYNEERDIRAKLENTLSIDYPPEKLEIIVASDCSSDKTDEIVREFNSRGVRLYRQTERKGKTSAQNMAVERATGEIILFPMPQRCMKRTFCGRCCRILPIIRSAALPVNSSMLTQPIRASVKAHVHTGITKLF